MDNWTGEVHVGDAAETMNQMPESSVHTVAFSPPYWGLRDYGTDGQLGLEETPGEYVSNMVDVGRAVRHVLRDDGSWYLNIGDTFAGGGGAAGVPDDWESKSMGHMQNDSFPDSPPARDVDYPSKSKLLIPHRVAIALIEDGWIIRNDNVWRKTNPMPESVTDRRSTTFEYVFHLVKKPDYWYDLDVVRETPTGGKNSDSHSKGKNPGDIIETTTASYSDAHFAVWPEELVKPLVQSSCPENVCVDCGKGYSGSADNEKECSCGADETEPGIVLDPFMGSGTTAVVAEKLGRRWVGIDLNDEFADMSVDRLSEETHYQTESLEKW